jgi:hypothetical protein
MLRSLIYIAVFAAGTFIGGIFPSYSVQYQQTLAAQLSQVSTDLALFQDIADRYHDGDMATLIRYHLNSEDPTFHDEGVAIQSMVVDQQQLAEASANFESSFFEQVMYLTLKGDPEVEQATWDSYTPVFVATEQALVFAVSIGLLFSVALYAIALMVRRFVRDA